MARIAPLCLALLLLGGCTTVGEARQDLGDIREIIRDAVRQADDSTGWRDAMLLRLEQDRLDAYLRAARTLADSGNLKGAEALWSTARKNLHAFKPAKDKLENVIEAVGLIKTAIRKEKEGS